MIKINPTYTSKVLKEIEERAVAKFFEDSATKIIFWDANEYIYRLLIQKKQNVYQSLIPILCNVVGRLHPTEFEDMIELLDPKNYRELHHKLEDNAIS